MKKDTNWQSIGIGIVAITIIGLVAWALFHEISKAPWQFITILVALFGALITFAGNLQIQIRNEQKPKKTEIYDQVINLFFDSILASKLGREPKSEEELVQGFADMTPNLIFLKREANLKPRRGNLSRLRGIAKISAATGEGNAQADYVTYLTEKYQ